MGSSELLSVDLVKEVIEANFNKYFKCMDVVYCIVAIKCGVSLGAVIDGRKCVNDPYDRYYSGLCGRVTWVLKRLKNEGYIEKYSCKVWMVCDC